MGAYYLQSGNFVERTGYTDGTSWFNYEIGANFNGSQFAIPTYGGAYIYDGSYNLLTVLGTYVGEQPVGVAYHPVENMVFFPWEGTSKVRVCDTKNLAARSLDEAAGLAVSVSILNIGFVR